jgi:hypothetical protein
MTFISKTILYTVIILLHGLISFAQVKKTTPVSKAKSSNTPIKKTTNRPISLKVGDKYKEGIVYEVYDDGSGGKVVFNVLTKVVYNTIMNELEGYKINGIKCYMADDYDLKQLFELGLVGPDAGDGNWNNLWFMGDRRMDSYSYPLACNAKQLLNLSDDSNERVSQIVKYGYKIDRYKPGPYAAIVGIFSLKK